MRINTNIASLVSLNRSRLNGGTLREVMERLSSGLRINKGADDPSGLGISKGMEAQARGLQVAFQDVQDGKSMIHLIDGALAEVGDMLQRMRDLAVRAANEATLTSEDMSKLNDEYQTLKTEINATAYRTKFNGKDVLLGDPEMGTEAWDVNMIPTVAGNKLTVSMDANGEKITYYDFTGTGDLYTQGTDGTGINFLQNSSITTGAGPKISGDGNKVVFIPNLAPGFLYSINSDGSGLTQITTTTSLLTTRNGDPITSDGTKVVYSRAPAGDIDVYIANTDGTGEVQLTTAVGDDDEAAISASGNKIVFVSNRVGNDDIFVVNPNGTGELQLTTNAGVDTMPSISGDGSKVVFTSDMAGGSNIFIINSDGSGLTQLTTTGDVSNAVISEDGTKISYVTAAGQLWRMDSDGSNKILVSNLAFPGSEAMDISADGEKISFRGGAELYLASIDTSDTEPLQLQVGPDGDSHFRIDVPLPDARSSKLGLSSDSLTTGDNARAAIDTVDAAIDTVNDHRARLGVLERRLDHILDDLSVERINTLAAKSRITDADMAQDISEFTKAQIISQSTTAVTAQANALPQTILQLLR
ncbi:MAG: flagellin [bacterium]